MKAHFIHTHTKLRPIFLLQKSSFFCQIFLYLTVQNGKPKKKIRVEKIIEQN